jgi:hypothetical protein
MAGLTVALVSALRALDDSLDTHGLPLRDPLLRLSHFANLYRFYNSW